MNLSYDLDNLKNPSYVTYNRAYQKSMVKTISKKLMLQKFNLTFQSASYELAASLLFRLLDALP